MNDFFFLSKKVIGFKIDSDPFVWYFENVFLTILYVFN